MQDIPVSFIIPTYNRGYIIKNAVNSILAQTDSNWELIVIDDGSTDNTKDVVASINDSRIVYSYQKNQGAAVARNNGIQQARGTWIAYLDSDNELSPKYLETMFSWINKNPKTIFCFPRSHKTVELYENGRLIKSINESNDTYSGVVLKDIYMKKLHVDTNGFMHLRSVYNDGIKWDKNISLAEDWDFAMSLGEKYPDGFLYIEAVLYNYHQRFGGDGMISNTQYKDWAIAHEEIYQKHKNDKLLVGQTWYPERVEKWNRLQKEFDEGKRGPFYLYPFSM
jgi:glycosyltransferase involved in cell wall biosynthesis